MLLSFRFDADLPIPAIRANEMIETVYSCHAWSYKLQARCIPAAQAFNIAERRILFYVHVLVPDDLRSMRDELLVTLVWLAALRSCMHVHVSPSNDPVRQANREDTW